MATVQEALDRLPFTHRHRFVVAVIAFAYFFELGDLNTFAFAATGILKFWHISINVVALITAASFGGMLVGALAGGWVSDTIGRRKAFFIATLIYTAGSLLNAFSWDVPSLAVFRFVTGIGLAIITVVGNTYITELFPARMRGRYMAIVMTVGLAGIPATAWFARFVVPLAPWGWRLVFVWGALGILVAPASLRLLESPRWLMSKGRLAEAREVIARYEEAAMRVAAGHVRLAGTLTADDAPVGKRRPDYARLFHAAYRSRTIVLVFTWFLFSTAFYGFAAWVPALLFKQGFSIVKSLNYSSLISICNPLGAALAISIIEKFERKHFIMLFSFFSAVIVVSYGWALQPVMIVAFGALIALGLQCATVALFTYTPEVYPTEIRSCGMGLGYGAGRIANVFGPFIVGGLYNAFGYHSVFLYIAACLVVCGGLVAIRGPRVTGRPLEIVSRGAGAAEAEARAEEQLAPP